MKSKVDACPREKPRGSRIAYKGITREAADPNPSFEDRGRLPYIALKCGRRRAATNGDDLGRPARERGCEGRRPLIGGSYVSLSAVMGFFGSAIGPSAERITKTRGPLSVRRLRLSTRCENAGERGGLAIPIDLGAGR